MTLMIVPELLLLDTFHDLSESLVILGGLGRFGISLSSRRSAPGSVV
jgi:hypothetical protein